MNARTWIACAGVAAAMTAGCVTGTKGEGQIGGETDPTGTGCKVTSTLALRVDEASPLGFSAADLLAALGAEQSSSLAWAKGGTSALHVTPGVPVAVRFLTREYEVTSDGEGIETLESTVGPEECGDVVEVDLPLGFATEDGQFNESWESTLTSGDGTSAFLSRELDLAAIRGSYTLTEVDPTEFDAVHVFLNAELSAGAVHGEIYGQAESSDKSGDPDGVASARRVEIASY